MTTFAFRSIQPNPQPQPKLKITMQHVQNAITFGAAGTGAHKLWKNSHKDAHLKSVQACEVLQYYKNGTLNSTQTKDLLIQLGVNPNFAEGEIFKTLSNSEKKKITKVQKQILKKRLPSRSRLASIGMNWPIKQVGGEKEAFTASVGVPAEGPFYYTQPRSNPKETVFVFLFFVGLHFVITIFKEKIKKYFVRPILRFFDNLFSF